MLGAGAGFIINRKIHYEVTEDGPNAMFRVGLPCSGMDGERNSGRMGMRVHLIGGTLFAPRLHRLGCVGFRFGFIPLVPERYRLAVGLVLRFSDTNSRW